MEEQSKDKKEQKEKKGKSKLLIPIIILLGLSIAGNVFLYLDGKNTETILKVEIKDLDDKNKEINALYDESMEMVNRLKEDSIELSDNLKAKIAEIEKIQEENERLSSTIKDKDALNRRLQASLNKIRALKDELADEIAALKKENEELKASNTVLKTSVDSLTEDNVMLTEKVNEAEKLKVEYIEAKTLKNRLLFSSMKDTEEAKKVDKLELTFKVLDNPLAKEGERTAYLRIITPDDMILSSKDEVSGDFVNEKGDTLKFSMKKEFNYSGEKESFSYTFADEDFEYPAGEYKVHIYIEGYKSAESTFRLE